MHLYAHGECRTNSQNAIAAVAVRHQLKKGPFRMRTRTYTDSPTDLTDKQIPKPTQMRAELAAISLGLDYALRQISSVHSEEQTQVVIHSDSAAVVHRILSWTVDWPISGSISVEGEEWDRLDLISEIVDSVQGLKEFGLVDFRIIDKLRNWYVIARCDVMLNRLEEGIRHRQQQL
ncbi:hypothetical protein BDV18DRAFT_163169 [Aspergillus unguis]